MKITPQEAKDIVVYQIGALTAFVKSEGGTMRHVKPHGALYNMAAKDFVLAKAIAEAISRVNPDFILVGQSGSQLIEAGKAFGLQTASEVFADRTYEDDGTLTPRDQADSVIVDHELAVRQVIGMLQTGTVRSRQGTDVTVKTETICIHGDGPKALEFAKQIRLALDGAGVTVQALQK